MAVVWELWDVGRSIMSGIDCHQEEQDGSLDGRVCSLVKKFCLFREKYTTGIWPCPEFLSARVSVTYVPSDGLLGTASQPINEQGFKALCQLECFRGEVKSISHMPAVKEVEMLKMRSSLTLHTA